MSDSSPAPVVRVTLNYKTLRAMFIAGFALSAVLTFVPSVRMKVGSVFGLGGEDRSLSSLDVIRFLFKAGQVGLGMLYVVFFAAWVAFLVLAVKLPRRWVFVSGACFTAFLLLLDFFTGRNENVVYYFIPQLLGYLAAALTLTGLWIKPPRS